MLTEWLNDELLSPEKKLSGEWYLFEYYTERGDELVHVEEKEIQKEKIFMTLDFGDSGELKWTSNINLSVLELETENLTWERKRNFLFISEEHQSEEKIHFQYAVEKDILKLLSKTETGKINFFGFFKRPEPTKNN